MDAWYPVVVSAVALAVAVLALVKARTRTTLDDRLYDLLVGLVQPNPPPPARPGD